MESGELAEGIERQKMSRVKSYGHLAAKNANKSQMSQNPSQKLLLENHLKSKQNQSLTEISAGDKLSREEAASLLLQYSNHLRQSPEKMASILPINVNLKGKDKGGSPRFLQINLKMFNNYLTSNNPQTINNQAP